MKKTFAFCVVALLINSASLRAQWQDQSFLLRPGWNAIYTHVDASHTNLDGLVGGNPSVPIDGIWLWKPALAPDRYLSDPQTPSDPNIDWAYWTNNPAPSDTLARLVANAAYLVRNSSSSNYMWTVRGKTTVPQYLWNSKGVNFLGFSTPETAPPIFTTFLSPAWSLRTDGKFYNYDDGNNDLTPSLLNPFFNTAPVRRGSAYWIDWKEYNRYFGAFDFTIQNPSGISFGSTLSQYSLRLKNNTTNTITVRLALVASAVAPAGQKTIVGIPRLLLRGDFNPTTLTYGHTSFTAPQTITLAGKGKPGSEVELILGVDRSTMTGNPGDLYAGILRMTDSLGFSQIDLPLSATVASKAGLWVGQATVTQVRHYLNNYQRDASGNPVLSVLTTNGARYVVTNVNTSLGGTLRPFPLRLIIHNDARGTNVYLFERIYTGLDPTTNSVIATTQSRLHSGLLAGARRISAPHLPWRSSNSGWKFGLGAFAPGGKMTNLVTVEFGDQASNPFLHTYHPDHDNLDAEFQPIEDPGEDSYNVERRIVLEFLPLPSDFGSLTAAGGQLMGNYNEDIIFKGNGTEQRTIQTAGTFQINRISPIDTLTR